MTRRALPILDVAPGLAGRPFVSLATPTPIEPMPGFVRRDVDEFAGRVFVKRDDVVSPLYGGNKVRRWEWLLGEALDRGARTVLTVGGTGSTQVTSLSAHGRAHGLSVTAILFDQPETPFVDEALELDAAFGATIVRGGGYGSTALAALRAYRTAEKPYFIAPGASGPIANLAYVDAMLEVGAQVERGELPRPDRIVAACGSGGTTVGLAIGAAMLGWRTEVVGVRITDLIASNPLTLAAFAAGTLRVLRDGGYRQKVKPRIRMDHRFIGQGYGHSTPDAEIGAAAYERAFGAPGEVTYSGKSLAALTRIAREHPTETILYWNTLSSTGRQRSPRQ